ncbi:MAG TPA: YlxR family protein [Candidatus Dormibacteraeota bacterium]|nr:YlxR family protein [Candidatus Dormibacteraeota bacterium]
MTPPVRTCVGCRQEAGKRFLIRTVRDPEGVVAIDVTGRGPGRGAYLHADSSCIETARKRKALERALRIAIPPEFWSELARAAAPHPSP